jgi:LacI family transcriptional regulator
MQHVADLAGVSKTTVSHVINETRPVSEELRRRVLLAMDELNYQPNILARSLRRKETFMIGLIVPRNDNPFYAEVARGVEEISFEFGYNVILCNSDRHIDKEIRYADLLSKKQVDGMLFVGAWAGDQTQHLQRVYEQGIPLVVVDRFVPDLDIDSIVTDNTYGGQMATSHLYELGHRRIGCLGGTPTHTPNSQRIDGYIKALIEFGVEIDDQIIIRSDFNFDGGYETAKRLLNLENPPTAIFACNDLMAIGAIRCALDMGLDVPKDISIIGFDDIQMAAYTNPPLTTIAQQKLELGKRGAEMLMERIHETELPKRNEVIDPIFIKRSSTSERG